MLQVAADAVGKEIAKQCKEKGIEKVCFDRSGYIYHGRVQVHTHLNRVMLCGIRDAVT